MNSESREQILDSFMELTGLENMEECIAVLDQHQWNLLNAVQAVYDRIGGSNDANSASAVPKPPTTVTKHASIVKKPNQNSKLRRHSDSDDNEDPDEPKIIKSIPGNSKTTKGASGGASRSAVRELNFEVQHKDQTEKFTICDDATFHQLQLKIQEKLSIPPSRQKITNNWTYKQYTDQTVLRDLNLRKETVLHLVATMASTANGTSRSSTTTANTTNSRTHRHPASPPKHASSTGSPYFSITVLYEDKAGKPTPYELVLKSNSTVADMKKEIEQVTHLPIKQQSWSGLMGAKDSDELQKTSINRKAQLILRRTEPSVVAAAASSQHTSTNKRNTTTSTLVRHRSEDEPMDIANDVDFEQYDDDINVVPQHFSSTTSIATATSFSRELLIPERCTDDIVGLEHFTRVFHSRFGSTGPILYIGSLDQAIQDSVLASRHERRPLAIYIHNDRSVCANVFCTQVLAGETTVEYLANNYVVWAWDITADSNRARLFETMKRCIGHQSTQRIATMDKDSYPLLLVLIRSRGSLELISVIEGKSTPSEVLLNLIQAHDLFEQQRQRDEEEEIMREKREDLKKQQETEYNQSLQADLAKEQARIDNERKQKEEQTAKERLKEQRLQQQRECTARLPAEPSETEKNTTRLKIRLPDDEGVLMRRFRINDPLQILFDYLTSQGRMFGEYKLLSTYPKRDLTTLNRSHTFEQLKLYPQEQLILETL